MKSNRFARALLTNLPWIFMALGFTFMLIGHMLPDHSSANQSLTLQVLSRLPNAFKSIGTTILGAGIFAAVLKSLQFTGIFQDELAKVVYSKEYLEKQSKSYLEETWTRVSQVMFTSKFPAISQRVESSVLHTYFPEDHNYYYEHVVHKYANFIVEELGERVYVTFDHEMSGAIIPIEKNGDFLWSVSYTAIDDENSFRKIEVMTIYHDEELIKDLKEEMPDEIASAKFEVRLTCKNGEKYKFKKVEKRKFRLDIPTNEQLQFETSKVTERMTVMIKFDPNQLDIYFVDKTIDAFNDMEISPGMIYKDYPNVLLPSHGFCLVLSKSSKKQVRNA